MMLELNPRRKPFWFVVVKPTRIFSAIVERHEPRKSYLMIESDLKFTPISENKPEAVKTASGKV